MRKALVSLLVVLACSTPCFGQTVTLPDKITLKPGRMAAVKVTYDGDDVRWDVPDALDCFREYDPDPKNVRLRVSAAPETPPGVYRLTAVAAKAGKLSPFAVCLITVPGPPTPPTPGPTPTPGPGPNPPAPTPAVAKNAKVLIVYPKDESKLTAQQNNMIYGADFRNFLDTKTSVDKATGWNNYRIWTEGVDASKAGKDWQDLYARPRASLPWMVIAGDGGVAWEGPLPADAAAGTALLSKYLAPSSQRKRQGKTSVTPAGSKVSKPTIPWLAAA